MTSLDDLIDRGRAALGADNAMLLKLWDVAGDFAVNLTVAILIFAGAVFLSRWASEGVRGALGKLRAARRDRTLVDFFAQVTRWVILIIGVIAVLQRLGVQTASIIAVLGAASLAIGLAIRGTLSDLAAGVMLLILRPYRVGDQLECGDRTVGRVRELDLFNTELATPDGRKVVVPNSKALEDIIVNQTAYGSRRADISVDIHYDSDIDHAFQVMRRVAGKEPLVSDPSRTWTGLLALKDSGMTVQLQVWVKPDDQAQATANLLKAVKEAFDAEGIVFPYPHQVAMPDDSPLARKGARQAGRDGKTAPRRSRARTDGPPKGDGKGARH
ncbi:MAG: mechanosensitive ion channel family protein [Caulobacteraceae bacterium]|nr:mechanosensitive ion channel family protein [Caulobacteraceae bacterium]